MTRSTKYPQEIRERAVRMVFEHEPEHPSRWATIRSVCSKFGMSAETLRSWVRQVERDHGRRPGLTTTEREQSRRDTARRGSDRMRHIAHPRPSGRRSCQDRRPVPCTRTRARLRPPLLILGARRSRCRSLRHWEDRGSDRMKRGRVRWADHGARTGGVSIAFLLLAGIVALIHG
jgi:transposase